MTSHPNRRSIDGRGRPREEREDDAPGNGYDCLDHTYTDTCTPHQSRVLHPIRSVHSSLHSVVIQVACFSGLVTSAASFSGVETFRMVKPNRSEEQGTVEEQEQHAQQVRAFLDANAPRRQLKPARSDAADMVVADETNTIADAETEPPEHAKYLNLVANGVRLETQGSGEVDEDYTESEYYQHVAAIDKAHHTTGSGFIKVGKAAPDQAFHLADYAPESGAAARREQHRGNPATNDWEPAPHTTVAASSKPLRSESSDIETTQD